VYLIVRLAIHVMNRAPEETINRSPSKHDRTGRRYGHPKGPCTLPVRAAHGERCGPRTAPTPCPVQRPHRIVARMGPVPFYPYQSRTVLPVPVYPVPALYRFARTSPVPFCSNRPRTVLPSCCPYNSLPAPTAPVQLCPCRPRTV